MIHVSDAFKAEVFERDNRAYEYTVDVTFADGTALTITNDDLIDIGGVSIDEAISDDSSLDIGACIVNKCTLTLQNYEGEFDEYDFRQAKFAVTIGLSVEGTPETFRRGTYFVADTPTYDPVAVTIEAYDYMALMDVPCADTPIASLYFPCTLGTLRLVLNTYISGTLGVSVRTQTLPCDTLTLPQPDFSTMTIRELLSYIGQINGMNCRCDEYGELYYTWYSTGFTEESAIVRSVGTNVARSVEENVVRVIFYQAAGEVIWTNQEEIPHIYSLDIERFDTMVTGVRVVIPTSGDDEGEVINTYITGTDDYLISIEDNPLVDADNAEAILAILAQTLVGFKYRMANLSHPGMPWLGAGDSALIRDAKGNKLNILVSSTVFSALDRQTTVSAGATASQNNPTRFSTSTQQYLKMMEQIRPTLSAIDEKIASANGLYYTPSTDPDTGATIIYLHDKPLRADSDIQIMVSTAGVLVTNQGILYPVPDRLHWFGIIVDGTFLANVIMANGLNVGNGNFVVNYDGTAILRAVILGSKNAQIYFDYHAIRAVDDADNEYFSVEDLRDSDGIAEIVQPFEGDGTTSIFELYFFALDEIKVEVEGVELVEWQDYTYNESAQGGEIRFTNAPSDGDYIEVTYTTNDYRAKAYNLGFRTAGTVIGALSVAEGLSTAATAFCSHAEGRLCYSNGDYSHSEGYDNKARASSSHAEGSGNTISMSADSAHAEGHGNNASGLSAHVEGQLNTASDNYAHAEGYSTTASNSSAHSEGTDTTASGQSSHSEGSNTVASGYASHAQNLGTKATQIGQTAIGTWNEEDTNNDYAFIVGNGSDDNNRSNALAVKWTGEVDTPNGQLLADSDTLFVVDSFTYSYTISGSATLNVSASDLSVVAPQGYTPVAIKEIGTGSTGVVVRSFNATTSGTVVSLRNEFTASVSETVTVEMLFVKSTLL